jgi:hypothetical protein
VNPDSCGLVAHVRLPDKDVVDLEEGQLVVQTEEIVLTAHAKYDGIRSGRSRGLFGSMYSLGESRP